MQTNWKKLRPNPRAKANPLSAITFFWTFELFRIGHRRELKETDLSEPLKEHKSSHLGDQFEEEWNKLCMRARKKGSLPSLWHVLIKVFGWETLGCLGAFGALDLITKLGQPLLLSKLLSYFAPNSTVTSDDAALYASGIAGCVMLYEVFCHPLVLALTHLGLKARVGFSSLMYRKLLRVTTSAKMSITGGYLINILTNDLSRFDSAFFSLNDILMTPIIGIIVSYMLWNEVGVAAFIGLSILFLFFPLQAALAKKSTVLRERTALRTDRRVQLMNEIITGIQAIKMYAWEEPFADLVKKVRRKEVQVIRTKSYILGGLFSCSIFFTEVALFVTVLYFASEGNPIKAETVFVLAMYYNILQETVTTYLPIAIQNLSEVYTSLKRIREFLMKEESASASREEISAVSPEIIFKNVCAKWSADQDNVLESLNFSVGPGSVTAIVGQVGCGKSSLLQLILREMPVTEGDVSVKGSVSYASQQAWLFPGTISQNILFGLPLDSRRYEDVIEACALEQDLRQLPNGDKTVIGDRGVNLSGGQRARVNLARAVYRQADIYLLDDPLSAVDAHVGRHLFENCICRFLAGKIVVLVTHQLDFLSNVNHIIVMEKGGIMAQGSFLELQSNSYFVNHQVQEETVEESHGDKHLLRRSSSNSFTSCEEMQEDEEISSAGRVKFEVYYAYFRAACNIPACLFGVFVFLFCQGVLSGSEYWVSYWVNLEEYYFPFNKTEELPLLGPMNREKSLWIYGVLVMIVVVAYLAKSMAFVYYAMQSSQRLHDRMFRTVSKATMHFFSNNPSGRILNRFSKDVGLIDEEIPDTMSDCLQSALRFFGGMVVIAIINYWLLVLFGIVLAYLVMIQRFAMSTTRSLKRLEGVTRSPIFTHANSTVQGLATIRSMHAIDILKEEFDQHQDLNTTAYYFVLGTNQAFGYSIDVLCALNVVVIISSFLFLDFGFKGGDVGLVITQGFSITYLCQWTLRQFADLENYMTSVERVLGFSKVESEGSRLDTPPQCCLPAGWPENGNITFKNVLLWYNPVDTPVLHNVTFTIEAGEKIGIVGRTGAGKSSLVNALFRLHTVEGLILIDGVDTSSIGLHDLRSKISIIPQEPVLFSGSLRRNLDPFEEFSDDDLWTVLEEVELNTVVKDMPGQLFSTITESGTNLSVGQRQLVCLARAILRKNKILVLDEATANMDPHTDQLIQSTLRKKFSHCTVLTIAHRLHTVIDSDRILVMDNGQVAEFGVPHELLQNPGGPLTCLVNQTGISDMTVLKAVAKSRAEKKLESDF